jgi:hypothetical protein
MKRTSTRRLDQGLPVVEWDKAAMSEEEEKKAFRVVDKRRFNSEGETRADVPDRPQVEAPNVPPRSSPPPQAQAAASNGRTDARAPQQQPAADEPAPRRRPPGPDRGGIDFIQFVASLATQALAAMGALPEARAQGIPVNLDMARD